MSRFAFVSVFFLLSLFKVAGQDYGWWNDLVNWDGKTPWQEYLDLSTRGLGPNALPVPEFHSDSIGSDIIFQLAQQTHFHPQESSWNLFASIEIPFNKQISVKAWIVPIEFYNTEVSLRDERKIRQFEPKGYNVGDLYFGTFIQLLKENQKRPFVLFSANLKTASGNKIEGGRVTETPGYYFDLLVAKSFQINDKYRIRPYVAGGLYVYQTFDGLHFQNDAILYGTGLKLFSRKQQISIDLNAYSGYLNIGDQPVMLRFGYERFVSKNVSLSLGLQESLRDSKYTTLMFGISHHIDRNKQQNLNRAALNH